LLSALDRHERSVVLAHENAHLRHRHHLYIHLVETCATALPFLRPFARKVKYLTERWADEVAAERVGSRDLVATTIARVALLPSSEMRAHSLSIGGGNVVTRVEALVVHSFRLLCGDYCSAWAHPSTTPLGRFRDSCRAPLTLDRADILGERALRCCYETWG
jgi:hypothetical protein